MTSLGRAALAALVALALAPGLTRGESDTPYWPSERDQRLEVVETDITNARRRLVAALYDGREDEANELRERIEKLRAEASRLESASQYLSAATGARPVP